MTNLYDFTLLNISLFFLIMVRISGIFITSPVFGRNNLPMIMKIALSALTAFILLPIISIATKVEYNNFFELALDTMGEFLLGIIIGFICFLYFNALYLAGSVIDTQIGFGMVNVLDPQINSQIPIMGNFYNLLITLIFLAVNGHHLIIRGLVYSFELLPIGFTYTLGEDFIIKVIAIMTETFVLAFRFSAPILAIIFLTNVLLGILARTMPQMNVFIVGLPLKLIVGIVTAIITLQFLMPFSEKLFDKMFGALFEIIQILARG